MAEREAQRIHRPLSSDEQARLLAYQRQVSDELPDLVARDQMRKDAGEETTLSGELRRAIHASDLSLSVLAQRVGITPHLLDDFLTGERTLRSDVMDRLSAALGYELSRSR
ncbi:MAG: helix-turn-helix transcriptional regulator [Planctomycetes bacterium]|nr:helix-turn-helix transcriptional regulator [Planctomycetota bacterium]